MNQAVQLQKMARGLKFCIKERRWIILSMDLSENKDADQLPVTVQLICTLICIFAKSRLPHDVAHLILIKGKKPGLQLAKTKISACSATEANTRLPNDQMLNRWLN